MKHQRSTTIIALLALAAAFARPASRARAEGIPEPPIVLYGVVTGDQGERLTSGVLRVVITPSESGIPITLTTNLGDVLQQFSYALVLPCESAPGGLATSAGVLKLSSNEASTAQMNADLDGTRSLFFYRSDQSSFKARTRDRGMLKEANLSTVPYEDTDGDGLLDSWERRFFGDLWAGPFDDHDRDGAPNLAEQRAGTNPLASSSYTQFFLVERTSATQLRLVWSSEPGLRYRIVQSANIVERFVPLDENLVIIGQPVVTDYTLTVPDDQPTSSFYQVEILP